MTSYNKQITSQTELQLERNGRERGFLMNDLWPQKLDSWGLREKACIIEEIVMQY